MSASASGRGRDGAAARVPAACGGGTLRPPPCPVRTHYLLKLGQRPGRHGRCWCFRRRPPRRPALAAVRLTAAALPRAGPPCTAQPLVVKTSSATALAGVFRPLRCAEAVRCAAPRAALRAGGRRRWKPGGGGRPRDRISSSLCSLRDVDSLPLGGGERNGTNELQIATKSRASKRGPKHNEEDAPRAGGKVAAGAQSVPAVPTAPRQISRSSVPRFIRP